MGRYITKWFGLLFWLFAAVWFAGWHLVIARDAWRDPLYRVPGAIGDNTVMLWNLGWVRHALNEGHAGFWFRDAYYPEGFFFLYGTPTWLDGFLFWIASPLLPNDYTGAILWANINHLMATVASGLLIICMLRAWAVRSRVVLMLVSSAVVFSWFRVFALNGHYHFFGTHWMLASLCIVSWARRGSLEARWREAAGRGLSEGDGLFLRRCAAAGLVLGITYLNDQAMTVFAAILGFVILVSATVSRREFRWRQLAAGAGIFYGCSLIMASIHLVPTVAAGLTGRLNYWVDKAPRLVDGTSLFLPPTPSYIGGKIQPLRDAWGLTWSEGTYVGIVQMTLLLVCTGASVWFLFKGRMGRRQRVMVWSTGAAWVFVICALGDRFVIGSEQFFTAPGRLLKEIPVINNIRLPQRWIWPAHLCIGLAGAMLLSQWLRGRRGGSSGAFWKHALVAGACVVPPLEAVSWPPVPALDYMNDDYLRPPVVDVVREQTTTGTVLMMPAYKAYGHANIFQFMWDYRTPMIMTYTARMPVKPEDLPWAGDEWTEAAGPWLREHDVSTVIFPYEDGSVERSREWIEQAKRAVPGIVVYDREGGRL